MSYLARSDTWVTPPYNAGDFTASGAMVWTVEAGDVLTFAYVLDGGKMLVNFFLFNTTIGGVLDSELFITVPAGRTVQQCFSTTFRGRFAGVQEVLIARSSAGFTTIGIIRVPVLGFPAAANDALFAGMLAISV